MIADIYNHASFGRLSISSKARAHRTPRKTARALGSHLHDLAVCCNPPGKNKGAAAFLLRLVAQMYVNTPELFKGVGLAEIAEGVAVSPSALRAKIRHAQKSA